MKEIEIGKIRVFIFSTGLSIIGMRDEVDLNLIHYPRNARISKEGLNLFAMIGDPKSITVEQGAVLYSYETEADIICKAYLESLPGAGPEEKPEKSGLVIPHTKKIII